MYCYKCSAKLPNDSNFCIQCGANLHNASNEVNVNITNKTNEKIMSSVSNTIQLVFNKLIQWLVIFLKLLPIGLIIVFTIYYLNNIREEQKEETRKANLKIENSLRAKERSKSSKYYYNNGIGRIFINDSKEQIKLLVDSYNPDKIVINDIIYRNHIKPTSNGLFGYGTYYNDKIYKNETYPRKQYKINSTMYSTGAYSIDSIILYYQTAYGTKVTTYYKHD